MLTKMIVLPIGFIVFVINVSFAMLSTQQADRSSIVNPGSPTAVSPLRIKARQNFFNQTGIA